MSAQNSGVDTSTAVAIVGLALAWLLYRLERAATRRREIRAARAVLVGVERGMVGGLGEELGWGERYFATNYTEEVALRAGFDTGKSVLERSYQQVLVVPTAPLEALIGSGYAGDLVTEPTVYYANLGLWHLAVFNQLVEQQTALVAQHLVEITDPDLDTKRRERIAEAITAQARMLHRRGVGEPFTDEGWYRRLKDSVASDIARLDEELKKALYPAGEARLAVGDAAAVIATLVVASILLATN
jgi:hypothetical protein